MEQAPEEILEVARARIGTVLRGKWCLDDLIGSGGMGHVYSATHRNGLRVAVKVLRPDLAASASISKRFLREGYAANRVRHPGAVQVLDDDRADDGTPFLVMELLEGQTLRAVWEEQDRRMAPRDVVEIFEDVLDVLAAAHARGIVHRDLKPENIFLTLDGRVKVLDFGIAQVRGGGAEGAQITRSDAAMGTPAFMAPEQARGRWDRVDARTDLWSVGAAMFTSLTGAYVHPAASANEVLVAAATQTAPPVAMMRRDLPRSLADVIDRALRFEPDERWQSAREMRRALREVARSSGLSGPEPSLLERARSAAPASDPIPDHPVSTEGRRDVAGAPAARAGAADATVATLDALPSTSIERAELAAELRGSSPPTANTRSSEPEKPRRASGPVVAAGVLTLGLLAGAMVWGSRRPDEAASATPSPASANALSRSTPPHPEGPASAAITSPSSAPTGVLPATSSAVPPSSASDRPAARPPASPRPGSSGVPPAASSRAATSSGPLASSAAAPPSTPPLPSASRPNPLDRSD